MNHLLQCETYKGGDNEIAGKKNTRCSEKVIRTNGELLAGLILVRRADTVSGSAQPLRDRTRKLVTWQTPGVWSSRPGGGWRFQARPHGTHRNTARTKRSGCTSQPLKACPSNKGGGRSLAHITHDRPPADTLLTGGHLCQNEGHNPWERLSPPLP